jgi:hypothetical protein
LRFRRRLGFPGFRHTGFAGRQLNAFAGYSIAAPRFAPMMLEYFSAAPLL